MEIIGRVLVKASATAHLLFALQSGSHWGKILMLKYETESYHTMTPGTHLSPGVVIKKLPLVRASLVANLPIQIFCDWNQSPYNLLNILNTEQHGVPSVDYPKGK